MATEYLYPNGNDAGWDTSAHGNCNEGFNPGPGYDDDSDGPVDATVISETSDDITLNLDLGRRSGGDGTAITDADTVTDVSIKIRARTTGGGNDKINIDWIVGGAAQGTQYTTANLTGSFADYTATGIAQSWTDDYSQAQLDGAQVRLETNQTGKAEALGVEVAEVEVIITYTEASVEEPYSAYHPTDQLSVRSRHI